MLGTGRWRDHPDEVHVSAAIPEEEKAAFGRENGCIQYSPAIKTGASRTLYRRLFLIKPPRSTGT